MPRPGKRSQPKDAGEWMRPAAAARRLNIPRTTLKYRVMRGDFKTKDVAGVTLIWIDGDTQRAA